MSVIIKLGTDGWANKVDALNIKYDGEGGCWLYSSLDKSNMLLQAKQQHAAALAKVFSPFEGQKGLLFSGGHKPEKYGLQSTCSYGGIHFVKDGDPDRHHQPERDLSLQEQWACGWKEKPPWA